MKKKTRFANSKIDRAKIVLVTFIRISETKIEPNKNVILV